MPALDHAVGMLPAPHRPDFGFHPFSSRGDRLAIEQGDGALDGVGITIRGVALTKPPLPRVVRLEVTQNLADGVAVGRFPIEQEHRVKAVVIVAPVIGEQRAVLARARVDLEKNQAVLVGGDCQQAIVEFVERLAVSLALFRRGVGARDVEFREPVDDFA